MGLVWNYQDVNNYFRVGLRQQPASGNVGGTEGLSVQKIVGGTLTQRVPQPRWLVRLRSHRRRSTAAPSLM